MSTPSDIGAAVGSAAAGLTGGTLGAFVTAIVEALHFANSVVGQTALSDALGIHGIDISGLVAANEADPKPPPIPK
jgi:hypothetical protein